MFQNQHYMTRGVARDLPPETALFLWQMVRAMPEPKDYLQVFRLAAQGSQQMVKHEQERPTYSQTA